ncbi:MAG: hypothetical protein ACC656_01115 [Candidatus Heimdallarchaeota archaeon]
MTQRVLKSGKFHFIDADGNRVVCRAGDTVDLNADQLIAFAGSLEPEDFDPAAVVEPEAAPEVAVDPEVDDETPDPDEDLDPEVEPEV